MACENIRDHGWSFFQRMWESAPIDEVHYQCLDCRAIKSVREPMQPAKFTVPSTRGERFLMALLSFPGLRNMRIGGFFLNYLVRDNDGENVQRQEGPYLTYAAAVEGARFMDTPAFSGIRVGRTMLQALPEAPQVNLYTM